MKDYVYELYDYICNLCETRNMPPVDLRFKHIGDVNKFWSSKANSYFEISCSDYYAQDIENAKEIICYIMETLWEYATKPNHRIGLYVEDIVKKDDGWISVTIGGCLIEDDALL